MKLGLGLLAMGIALVASGPRLLRGFDFVGGPCFAFEVDTGGIERTVCGVILGVIGLVQLITARSGRRA